MGIVTNLLAEMFGDPVFYDSYHVTYLAIINVRILYPVSFTYSIFKEGIRK